MGYCDCGAVVSIEAPGTSRVAREMADAIAGSAGAGPTKDLPLAGLRVLDLTLARAGPTCVRHLADWGAEVIAIRHPDSRNELIAGAGSDYENLHRNKRLIRLDLKTPLGL